VSGLYSGLYLGGPRRLPKGSPTVHAARPLASHPFRVAPPETTSRIRRACLVFARRRCERHASLYSAHRRDGRPASPARPRSLYHFSVTTHLRERAASLRRQPAPSDEPPPTQCQRRKKALFSERRHSLNDPSPLRGRRPLFTNQSLPPAQLLTRRYADRSKQRAFARCESGYLASFRHAKATRRPRPALTFRAKLGARDQPKLKVPARGEPLTLPQAQAYPLWLAPSGKSPTPLVCMSALGRKPRTDTLPFILALRRRLPGCGLPHPPFPCHLYCTVSRPLLRARLRYFPFGLRATTNLVLARMMDDRVLPVAD